MKKLLLLGLIAFFCDLAIAKVEVVYGVDNRRDVYEISNSNYLKMARATAGMVRKTTLYPSTKANFFNASSTLTLEKAENLCPNEKFAQQKLLPICSGFLVGPDTIVTAGHCYNAQTQPEIACKDYAWVFDYNMKSSAHDPTTDISIGNIYHCKKVMAVKRDFLWDYAVIKLDRPVVGRQPVQFRSSGKIESNASLLVIGHPSGLPTKISDGGKVTHNTEDTRFSTNLDTFHGNSGSAVFNVKTGQVEGILIMGKTDYRPTTTSNGRSCQVVNLCDDNAENCAAGNEGGTIGKGEVALRIEKIVPAINQALLSI